MNLLEQCRARLDQAVAMELAGTVTRVRGLAVWVAGLSVPIGALVRFESGSGGNSRLGGQVVGFDRQQAVVLPLETTEGIRSGDRVICEQLGQTAWVGPGLLGRVVDAMGRPLDGGGPVEQVQPRPLIAAAVGPLERLPIDQPLTTGVRVIDAMLSVGQGQRLGVLAMPGVGKSTLLGMMARQSAADVNVIALVGERGREVRAFLDHHLGAQGLLRSVVVCATSDQAAPLRVRAAQLALAAAEWYRDAGQHVLLIMDSVTRFCQAQRQIGLAAGEPAASRGFPPSVFAMLPALLERCGRTAHGSITGFFSVLTEGDPQDDPVAEAVRSVLDGHIMLSESLAQQGHWPAVDLLASISRLSDELIDPAHHQARRRVRQLVQAYQQVRDLLEIGAYVPGSNPQADLAIKVKPMIDQFLQQPLNLGKPGKNPEQRAGADLGDGDRGSFSAADFAQARQRLLDLVGQIERQADQSRLRGNTTFKFNFQT